jgi:CHAT domain-containing protein
MISREMPGSEVFQQKKLSESFLKEISEKKLLEDASILHFALHGMGSIVTGEKDNSLIVTEPDGGTEDGYLQFYEIYFLNIHPRLVCLSACETAYGTPAADGSNASLAMAFLAAGAGSCIGTNWKVSDEGTTLFMKEFYSLVKSGVNYADALHQVKQKFISGSMGKQFQQPFFWAPFKYYGF